VEITLALDSGVARDAAEQMAEPPARTKPLASVRRGNAVAPTRVDEGIHFPGIPSTEVRFSLLHLSSPVEIALCFFRAPIGASNQTDPQLFGLAKNRVQEFPRTERPSHSQRNRSHVRSCRKFKCQETATISLGGDQFRDPRIGFGRN
jgi:hypothetical protein